MSMSLPKGSKLFGKCLCGTIKFEISGESSRVYQCHCSLCRKASGSSSNSAMLVNSNGFSWLNGENHIMKYSTKSGFKSEFCKKCGSPVPNKSGNGKLYWVPAGLLEEPIDKKIAVHLYVDSSASWDKAFLDDSVPKHSEMPEQLEFLKLLHEKNS